MAWGRHFRPKLRGDNFSIFIPRGVSIAGLIQNVISAVLIFLLLGIRNLLKVK